MPATRVDINRGDGWTLVTLASSGGLNKLGSEALRDLLNGITEGLSDGCRCLGVVGRGGSFAVGADLTEMEGLTPSSAREFSALGGRVFRLLEASEVFVVAGIDGFCLGGGLDLALAADWRIATETSIFGHPGADLGLITGFGGTQRLPRLIGTGRALSWFYSAARVSAREAFDAGLVQELAPAGSLDQVLMARVRGFAALKPGWTRTLKDRFRRFAGGGPREAYADVQA